MPSTGQSTASSKPKKKKRAYLPAPERRNLVLVAAREVFAKSGLKGARTRELAQSAGVNQATLFEHFRSKEELFSAAIVEPLESILKASRQRAVSYANASSKDDLLKRIHEGLEQHLHSMVEIYPLLVQALFNDQDLGTRIYNEQLQPMLASTSQIMKNFIDEDVDPKLVQLASFGMLFALATDQALSDNPIDIHKTSRQLSDIILFGSSNHKKPKKSK